MEPHEIDAELSQLAHNAAARTGLVDSGDEEGWIQRRDRRDSAGSYRELERSLERLSGRHRRALGIVYDFGIPYRGNDSLWRTEREAVVLLSGLMPTRIRVPKGMFGSIRILQAQLIQELGKSALSIQEISRFVGCRKRFVWEVLHPT